jgi:hypothetical protein
MSFAWSSHISIPNCSYLLWCTYCDDALPQDVKSHRLLINSIGDTWCAVEFSFSPFHTLQLSSNFHISGPLFVILNPAPNLKMLGLLQVISFFITKLINDIFE